MKAGDYWAPRMPISPARRSWAKSLSNGGLAQELRKWRNDPSQLSAMEQEALLYEVGLRMGLTEEAAQERARSG